MSKFLRVTMSDGSNWDVPAEIIADNRAKHYAKADSGTESGPEYDKEYAAEYEYTLNDAAELKDWAANNMDWNEVAGKAIWVTDKPKIDYQEGWVNGDREIVEHD